MAWCQSSNRGKAARGLDFCRKLVGDNWAMWQRGHSLAWKPIKTSTRKQMKEEKKLPHSHGVISWVGDSHLDLALSLFLLDCLGCWNDHQPKITHGPKRKVEVPSSCVIGCTHHAWSAYYYYLTVFVFVSGGYMLCVPTCSYCRKTNVMFHSTTASFKFQTVPNFQNKSQENSHEGNKT